MMALVVGAGMLNPIGQMRIFNASGKNELGYRYKYDANNIYFCS